MLVQVMLDCLHLTNQNQLQTKGPSILRWWNHSRILPQPKNFKIGQFSYYNLKSGLKFRCRKQIFFVYQRLCKDFAVLIFSTFFLIAIISTVQILTSATTPSTVGCSPGHASSKISGPLRFNRSLKKLSVKFSKPPVMPVIVKFIDSCGTSHSTFVWFNRPAISNVRLAMVRLKF